MFIRLHDHITILYVPPAWAACFIRAPSIAIWSRTLGDRGYLAGLSRVDRALDLPRERGPQRDSVAVERRQSKILKGWRMAIVPRTVPNMAEVFRHEATMLAAALEHEGQRDSSREALRGFVEQIIIRRAMDS